MLKRIKDSILDILRQADWLLLCLCCGAALFGLVMIASATNFLGSWKMVIVQACAIVLGVGIYFLMSQIDLTEASKRWKWLLGFGIVLFLLLKTPLGIENNGNRAWLGIRGFPANIQPAEIVKITFILVLAKQLAWLKENRDLSSIPSILFLGVHFGFQLECLVFCFQDGFFSFLVCGLDRFVHQAGSLGLGTADLSLSGFFTVVITNKITRGTCHNGDHDYDHNHCDCGHRVHSPQKIKFNETLRNRAWVFEKIQLSTEK